MEVSPHGGTFFKKFIYSCLHQVFTAPCRFSLDGASRDYSPVAVHGLLTAVASLVVSTGSRVHGLSSCGAQAYLSCNMWNLPKPRIRPVCSTLAGGFLIKAPPGKSLCYAVLSHSVVSNSF